MFNCSQPEVMEPAIAAAATATHLPIGVYANAFVLDHALGATAGLHDIREDVTPEAYLELSEKLDRSGRDNRRWLLRDRP